MKRHAAQTVIAGENRVRDFDPRGSQEPVDCFLIRDNLEFRPVTSFRKLAPHGNQADRVSTR